MGLGIMSTEDQLVIDQIDQCSNFITAFSETVTQHDPLQKQTKKELRINIKPCITKVLLKSIKSKNTFYQFSLKGKTADITQHKTYCNKLIHLTEQAKTL